MNCRLSSIRSLILLILLAIRICKANNEWGRCPVFCGLVGQIPNSNCSVKQLDSFNVKVNELLSQIIVRPYFRFYKTQLKPNCSFWPPVEKCFGQGCSVDPCSTKDLPDQIARNWNSNTLQYSHTICEANDPLGNLDMSSKTLCQQNCEAKGCSSQQYIFGYPTFCDIPDDEDNPDSVFVDLQKNPERYTGYRGESSWRIWKAIYDENCCWSLTNKCRRNASPVQNASVSKLAANPDDSQNIEHACLENKIFYSIVSGFHTSVNIHVCAQFYFPDSLLTDKWDYNLPEFTRRFGSAQTNGQGTCFLKNLYFVYLLELRALIKATPYLRTLQYDDGATKCRDELSGNIFNNEEQPHCCTTSTFISSQCLMNKFLDYVNSLDCMFDESTMFQTDSVSFMDDVDRSCLSDAIKETFRSKFVNITKIMDCVACDKCRMWGRIQIKAIARSSYSHSDIIPQLKRSQVVALMNGFARCSESLQHIVHFRKMSNEMFHSEL
ncbi:hypothetical protein GJ496_006791 [Pomphorhynchus laevis]|nr:hypothetical protein GJ496_006791 [Pomphorhynchus laevis]